MPRNRKLHASAKNVVTWRSTGRHILVLAALETCAASKPARVARAMSTPISAAISGHLTVLELERSESAQASADPPQRLLCSEPHERIFSARWRLALVFSGGSRSRHSTCPSRAHVTDPCSEVALADYHSAAVLLFLRFPLRVGSGKRILQCKSHPRRDVEPSFGFGAAHRSATGSPADSRAQARDDPAKGESEIILGSRYGDLCRGGSGYARNDGGQENCCRFRGK
jgi:hypothetical protein